MKQGFDYIGTTCVFYCYDSKDRLLLHKRSRNCRDEIGRWDGGGGSIKFGEIFEQAVRREVKEEYCVNIEKLTFVGVNNVIRKHRGRKTHWVAVLFACLVDPEKVKIGDKVKMADIGWFSRDKLPKPLHSMYLIHLEFVKKLKVLGRN